MRGFLVTCDGPECRQQAAAPQKTAPPPKWFIVTLTVNETPLMYVRDFCSVECLMKRLNEVPAQLDELHNEVNRRG